MISRIITLPELGMISGTRAALGAGIGLLMADRLSDDQRRAVGWTLLAVGAISTIPLLAEVMSHSTSAEQASARGIRAPAKQGDSAVEREEVLAGL